MYHYHHQESFTLESGATLPEFQLAYTAIGTRLPDDSNVVWVCHALTGNANPSEWWDGLVGEGKLYDPAQHYIICANVLGSHYGSTNSLSINSATNEPYYHQFPSIVTIRDVVKCLILLRKHLNIQHIDTCIGGSLGGQQALEWAIQEPDLIKNLIVMATNAIHSPWGIAFNESQRMAIMADNTWYENRADAGMEGLKVARSIALLSYRHYDTYGRTQARDEGQIASFRACTYQNYQGEKLANRFNTYSYMILSRMMDSHDVGRGRGKIEAVLAQLKPRTLVIGISSDVLFPPSEQAFLAQHIPNASYFLIQSIYGHDGFLIEYQEINQIIRDWIQ